MFRFVLLFSVLFSGTIWGQSPSPKEAAKPPQIDVAEVLRRGDMVVVAGEGPRGAAEDAMKMATAPPPDESHMWFVTVIKTPNCQYCTKLHSDFQSAPELLAFVSAATPYKPWGHYNEYNVNDETQKWRIKAYRITGYPTIVIQPPRNGMWGNPRTVVYQSTGYDGNPKKLASQITAGVRKYAAKMSEQGYPKISDMEFSETTVQAGSSLWGEKSSAVLSSSFPVVVGGSHQYTPEPTAPPAYPPVDVYSTPAGREQMGTNPPFTTPPRVDPFNPQPLPNNPTPVGPPSQYPPNDQQPFGPTPSVGGILSLFIQMIGGLLGGGGMTNLLLLVMVGIHALTIIAPLTKTKLDDEALSLLQKIADRSGDSSINPAALHNKTG